MIKLLVLGAALSLGQAPRDNDRPVAKLHSPQELTGPAATSPYSSPLFPPQGNPKALPAMPAQGKFETYSVVMQDKDDKKKDSNGKDEKKNGNGEDDKKDDDDKKDEGPFRLIEKDINGWKIFGHTSFGYYYNANNPNPRFNGPWTLQYRDYLTFNQLDLVLEKGMSDDFAIGGRFEAFFGNDYNAYQSRGFELRPQPGVVQHWNNGGDYGIALPQLYLEAGSSKMSLAVGHFNTPVGYEVVQDTANFFRTHAYSFMFGEPFTHWGALAKFAACDELGLNFGVVNGWDTLDRPADRAGFLVGGKYTDHDKKWYINYNSFIGDEQTLTGNYQTRFNYSLYLGLTPTEKFEYVIEHVYGVQDQGVAPGQNAQWYSVNNYFLYKFNDCVRGGMGFEWFRDNDGFAVGAINRGNPNTGPYVGNFFDVRWGLNWTPNSNLCIRPELRYDWFDGSGSPFGGRDHQFVAGVDVVIQF